MHAFVLTSVRDFLTRQGAPGHHYRKPVRELFPCPVLQGWEGFLIAAGQDRREKLRAVSCMLART